MIFQIVIIPLVLIAAGAGYYFFSIRNVNNTENIEVRDRNLSALEQRIKDDIFRSTSSGILGSGLTLEATIELIKIRSSQRESLRNAGSGNIGARKSAKRMVRAALEAELKRQHCDIDRYIEFNLSNGMEPRTMHEVLMYTMCTEYQNKLHGNTPSVEAVGFMTLTELDRKMRNQNDAFANMVHKYNIRNQIDEIKLTEIYEKEKIVLSDDEKMDIATQIIFSDLFGLRIIDSLNYQMVGLEELQLGTNGVATKLYNVDEEVNGISNAIKTAKDSVSVMFEGRLIWLSYLGFNTEVEYMNCIDTTIANTGAGDLTEATPNILTQTVDNRRIQATISPKSDAPICMIRKFDNIPETNIYKLYSVRTDNPRDTELVIGGLIQIAHSFHTTAIIGPMGAGKTTGLRVIGMQTPNNYAIGSVEYYSFELNMRKYCPDRNVVAFKIYGSSDEDETLAMTKKTTRPIWMIGEVTQPKMANMAVEMSKTSFLLFTAHYTDAESLLRAFVTAKTTVGGYNPSAALEEVVHALHFNVEIMNKDGNRYINRITEIVPTTSVKKYEIVEMLSYDPDKKEYVIGCKPSHAVFDRAKLMLSDDDYRAFVEYYDKYYDGKYYADEVAENPDLLKAPVEEVDEFADASWIADGANDDEDLDEI
jgi:pilus assembly protein CpaF